MQQEGGGDSERRRSMLNAQAFVAPQFNSLATVTLPLHYRYFRGATVQQPGHRYITVTLPLHYRYITVAPQFNSLAARG